MQASKGVMHMHIMRMYNDALHDAMHTFPESLKRPWLLPLKHVVVSRTIHTTNRGRGRVRGVEDDDDDVESWAVSIPLQ